ncbi:hypothetical protein R6Q57_014779 [Mikania cordata]
MSYPSGKMQVTKLKCGGIVIGVMVHSRLVENVFVPFSPPLNLYNDMMSCKYDEHRVVNRVYYIEGNSIKNGELNNKACNVVIAVDGRRRLGEKDGEEKQKLMASHFGNVLSMPYKSKVPEELKEMSLSNVAKEVQEFLKPATTKEHFLDIIDLVEDQKPRPLILKALVDGDMTFTVSAGQRFETMDTIDFGWGKVTFGSCHIPYERSDFLVMTMGSPKNNEDWIVYMHMPMKHMSFVETHASHVFKLLNTDYIQI